MSNTVAEHLVDALEELGVSIVFGLPGVHNLSLWDALRNSQIRLIGVRHEQTAVYAADGHARTSGELGVAITTTGPGAANAVAATGEAWTCGSPVLVIATDIPSTLRKPGKYRGVLHETRNQASMFETVVWMPSNSGGITCGCCCCGCCGCCSCWSCCSCCGSCSWCHLSNDVPLPSPSSRRRRLQCTAAVDLRCHRAVSAASRGQRGPGCRGLQRMGSVLLIHISQ